MTLVESFIPEFMFPFPGYAKLQSLRLYKTQSF